MRQAGSRTRGGLLWMFLLWQELRLIRAVDRRYDKFKVVLLLARLSPQSRMSMILLDLLSKMENETFHPVSNRTVFIPPEDAPKEDDKDMWVQHGLPSLMGIVSQQEYQPYRFMKYVFDDAKYSDMTITLSDGQQYKLQKAILCATSYALGFEIEQLEKIRQEKIRHRRVDTTALNMNIFTHHPAVVKQAIYYIYHRSYTEPSCTCEYLSKRSPDKGADARPRILHNTMVYDFARAYCIQELEQKALEKIAPDLVYEAIYFPKQFPELLRNMCDKFREETAGEEQKKRRARIHRLRSTNNDGHRLREQNPTLLGRGGVTHRVPRALSVALPPRRGDSHELRTL
ncbi:hypothetical protein HDK64DRAFT_255870 [Phyllosticta capitalensis]